MTSNWHRYDLQARRQWLTEAGFARNADRIWAHADGRAVGESVIAALTDEAFARYLRIELPPQGRDEEGIAA
jgi:hypothetical protein